MISKAPITLISWLVLFGAILFIVAGLMMLDPQSRWIGHAITGIFTLALICSIILSGASLAKRIGGTGAANVFRLHRDLGVLFCATIIGTFFLGILTTIGHGEPVLISIHGWLGIIVVIIAIIQLVPSLVIKNRKSIRFFHRVFGYLLAPLVVMQVTGGIYVTVVSGGIKPLVILHSTIGGLSALAFTWILIEMVYLSQKGIMRIKIISGAAAILNTIGCWILGGYYYLTSYSAARSIILSGSQPWAHRIVMETKEHIFLFLPILSILLFLILILLGDDDALIKDKDSRRTVLIICSLALGMVILIFIMGAIVSNAANTGTGGMGE